MFHAPSHHHNFAFDSFDNAAIFTVRVKIRANRLLVLFRGVIGKLQIDIVCKRFLQRARSVPPLCTASFFVKPAPMRFLRPLTADSKTSAYRAV